MTLFRQSPFAAYDEHDGTHCRPDGFHMHDVSALQAPSVVYAAVHLGEHDCVVDSQPQFELATHCAEVVTAEHTDLHV
jgi:hypothetical protein